MTFEASSQTDLNWILRFFDKKITKICKTASNFWTARKHGIKKKLVKSLNLFGIIFFVAKAKCFSDL